MCNEYSKIDVSNLCCKEHSFEASKVVARQTFKDYKLTFVSLKNSVAT